MATTMVAAGRAQIGDVKRRRVFAWYDATILALALAVTATQLNHVGVAVTTYPALWIVAGLAGVAGTVAFVAAAPRYGPPTIICPTICFTFAILLCWGLGPAILAQLAAVIVVAWKLRRPVREAVLAAGQYTLSFAAAEVVLWLGKPDPFQRHGPTNLYTDAITVVGAVGAWLGVYGLLALALARWRYPGRSRHTAGTIGYQILFNAALLLLSPVLAVAAHINIGFLPLVFVPLYAVQRMAKLSAERDRAARLDPLTGLANRTGLRSGFDELVDAYEDDTVEGSDDKARSRRATLFILDLDRFKHVNDALGHDVGDQLLVAVARRIGGVPADGGTIARLGGDEFAIVAPTDGRDEADAIARAVVQALSEPVALDRLRVDVSASIGIAVHADANEDFATLMRHADVAMYEAKKRGNNVATYAPRTDQNSPERLGLLTDFRDVLESGDRDQITMHYQPQVSLVDDTVEGVEALLRWRHPRYGLIDTQHLLTIAEHSSVMQLLTSRVVDDVVAQLAAWKTDGICLRASLNVSARDLYSNDIVTRLAEQLASHRVDPAQIQVEITESALLADPARAQVTIGRIAALGVAVSLDDFGTGYSSLQHLRKLPITELKIDRSFVAGMTNNRDDAAIVRSTIEMARSLGIRTVAEGVETEYTRQLLSEVGCTLAQGWLTGYPMPGVEVGEWLSNAIPSQDRECLQVLAGVGGETLADTR